MVTEAQLLGFFADFNELVWPLQFAAYVIGIIAVYAAARPTAHAKRIVPATLAFFYLCVALLFWFNVGRSGFAPGYLLCALFLAQGVLFLVESFRPRMTFGFQSSVTAWAGVIFLAYALVGYPAAGYWVGHIYPQSPSFGLTPCPLITFTFGLLLLTRSRVPKALLIIPLFWAISGCYWALIGIVEDLGMALSGVVGAWLLWRRDARQPAASEPVVSERGWSLDVPDKR